MKVFLPFQQDLNPYLDEITRYSENEYYYGSFNDYNSSFEVVNIHWPEAIFNWMEPSDEQLSELETHILNWKKESILVYNKHDFQRNKGTTPNFTRLFDLIESQTDIFIHLGKFSHEYYSEKYPEAGHEIVLHPLYRKNFKVSDKSEARANLKIDEDALVIIVPGNIRSYQERDLILKSFKNLNTPDKVLICTNIHSEIRLDFPGRIKLKRLVDVKKQLVKKFRSKYKPPEFIFTYNRIPDDELALKMSASDIVLIPRRNNLNSGIFFLALSYNKIVVGPECGNIEEQLNDFGFPTFNPRSFSSVRIAIAKGVELRNSGFKIAENKLKKYEPEVIALKMDQVLQKVTA